MGQELKEMSKTAITANVTIEAIAAGSLQRIANATELMAKSYQDLIEERDYYKNSEACFRDRLKCQIRQNTALRGVITRMKNKKSR